MAKYSKKHSKKQTKKRANKRQSKTQKKNQSYIPAKNTQKKQQDALNPARQTWLFNALDTLFFRESRPMDSLGNAELGSLFPPSARTLIGAIRAALGIINDIDWRAYREQKQQHLLAALIGYGDDLAALRFSGVWLYKNGERLYPAPRNLMQKQDKKEQDKKNRLETVFFLQIANDDELTHCDLGKIRLPRFNKDQAGSRALDNTWLTASAFEAVLAGECPDPKHWITGSDLWVEEPRVGIARDNKTRSVEQGKLYQTKHIRLVDGVQPALNAKTTKKSYFYRQYSTEYHHL